MPFSLVPTPFIETILNHSTHPQADQAIEELNRLRDVQCHLLTHYVAVQRQTQASGAGLQSLISEIKPKPSTHLTRGQLE